MSDEFDGKTRTPWGIADYRDRLAPGVTVYYTPSHGGIKLSASRMDEVRADLKPYLQRDEQRAAGWFEEDCDWAIVAASFPGLFPTVEADYVELVLTSYVTDA